MNGRNPTPCTTPVTEMCFAIAYQTSEVCLDLAQIRVSPKYFRSLSLFIRHQYFRSLHRLHLIMSNDNSGRTGTSWSPLLDERWCRTRDTSFLRPYIENVILLPVRSCLWRDLPNKTG